MLHRILLASLTAGILTGLIVSGLQLAITTPLILKAETYEKAQNQAQTRLPALVQAEPALLTGLATEPAMITPVHNPGHAHNATAWTPKDGLERSFYTTIATISTAFGFALMLIAVMILSGATITVRSALSWGAAAFIATGLAPALGLSPELPGTAAADLLSRQIWWGGTALATAAGLFLLLRLSDRWQLWAIAGGIILLALPHLIGAPHPHELTSQVPAELAAQFATASLALHAIMWALIGSTLGFVWQRSS